MNRPYDHVKRANLLFPGPASDSSVMEDVVEDVRELPGKAVERLQGGKPGETPMRGYEDLKLQYFGPTVRNKQRLLEAGDVALYQGSYGIPSAAAGYYLAGVPGALTGGAIGKLLGQTHLWFKEKQRLDKAKQTFTEKEKKLLKKISKSSLRWAIGLGLLGGLGVGTSSYLRQHDRYGKTLTPLLEGGAAGTLGTLAGTWLGHYLARREASKDKRYRDIIRRYDRFT